MKTAVPPVKQYVKYVPVGYVESHSTAVGYLLWLVGFTGAHRFYFGKPVSGVIWFCTFGLLGIGWLVDLFLIPSMSREAGQQYCPGNVDYTIAWLLLAFFGVFGMHRFYQGKIFTGLLYLLTGGLFLIGYIYDVFTMNEQISELHQKSVRHAQHYQMVW
jgi:TM2 domain-containing membrane protein YozV